MPVRRITVRTVRAATCALAIAGASWAGVATTAPSARADDPLPSWTSLLPALGGAYDPASRDICRSGSSRCVDAVLREMDRRLVTDSNSCSHVAPFALLYDRVTGAYRAAVTDPNFFADNAFVNHEDAIFASYYFDARDAWTAGRAAQVPEAWRIALDAADRHAVSSSGDLTLGVNAHVNRDLPFVLERIGLIAPDGTSRKADHDRVNVIFDRAYPPALHEAANRLDPTMDDADVPGTTFDDRALVQTVVEWREEAWRNAEQLVAAPTPAARALVADRIEQAAATKARALVAANAYPPGSTSAARDAYCAAARS